MSTSTTNYNLTVPELSDTADITAYNENWEKIDKQLAIANMVFPAISENGKTYTITSDAIPEVYPGLEITILPNMTNTDGGPLISINGKTHTVNRLSFSNQAYLSPDSTLIGTFNTNFPVKIRYYSSLLGWVIENRTVSDNDIDSTISIAHGGTGANSAAKAVTNLGIIDYVVARGATFDQSDNLWSYRKWNNGTIDCWGTVELNVTTHLDSSNNYCGITIENGIQFPDGLFATTPLITVTPLGGGYPCVMLGSPTVNGANVVLKTEWEVTNQTIWINVQAIGTWK